MIPAKSSAPINSPASKEPAKPSEAAVTGIALAAAATALSAAAKAAGAPEKSLPAAPQTTAAPAKPATPPPAPIPPSSQAPAKAATPPATSTPPITKAPEKSVTPPAEPAKVSPLPEKPAPPKPAEVAPAKSTEVLPTKSADKVVEKPADKAPEKPASLATNLAAAATALSAAAVVASAESKTEKKPADKVAPLQKAAPVEKKPAPTEPIRAKETTTTTTTTVAPRRGSLGWLWTLLALAVVAVAGYFLWKHFYQPANGTETAAGGAHAGGHGGKRNEQARVVTAVATRSDIPVYVTGLGAVTPLNTVTVQSRVNGQLMKVLFTEGQMVHAGDHLLQIDDRPFVAQVEQLKAQKEHDEALLENAMIDLERYQTLWKQDSIPQQTLATQASLVKQDQGTVDSDQAQIDAAQLNITYSDIIAPIDGRVGLRLVDVGNYIQATGTSGLLVITQIQPITVVFTIPEDSIGAVATAMKRTPQLPVDAYTRGGFTQKLASGNLLTIDNQIDPTTGTVKLKATFPNIDNALFPNQFVNSRMLVDTKKNVVTVPIAAVQYGANNSTYVYVLNTDDNTVKLQDVTTGEPGFDGKSFDGQTIEISKGISENDTVITDGVDKLTDGAKVVVSTAAEQKDASGAAAADTSSDATGATAQHHHHKKPASGDTNAAPAS